MIGLITGELLPEFRSSGFFDMLRDVVETGRPYHHEGAKAADSGDRRRLDRGRLRPARDPAR